MRPHYLYIYLLLLSSCTGTVPHEPKMSFRDSVIKAYKEEANANRKFDTSDLNYEILNAYAANDSLSLNKILHEINTEKENRKWWGQLDSCIRLTSLNDMDIDEGYRFEYDGGLCPLRQITTICKRNDTIKLNFQLYQLKWDTADCRKLDEFDRLLTLKNWKDFLDKVDRGDFWGLKNDNNRSGLDGSTYYITGYKKTFNNSPAKNHFVYRWEHTSLYEAFEFATQLAANKKGCLTIGLNK